ncbi:MAG: diguanylate cyclase [Acidimicrobiales bacterium]|nr:diguanylate cyclase [Acidimicrobiales bacterium]
MRPAPLGRARKTAPFGRALLAVAIVWATCGVFAGSAGAQEPFPDPASMDLAELTGHAQVWLTAEIDLLAELDAFGPNDHAGLIDTIRRRYPTLPGTRDELITDLRTTDADGALLLAELGRRNITRSPVVLATLGRLSSEDLGRLDRGVTRFLDPTPYLYALTDLLVRDGAVPPLPRDLGELDHIVTFLDVVGTTAPVDSTADSTGTENPATESTATESGSDEPVSVSVALGSAVATLLVAVGMWRLQARRLRGLHHPAHLNAHADVRTPPAGTISGLLDAARRMTAALDPSEVVRIACAEAARLTHAEGAALCLRTGRRLTLAHETTPHLVAEDRLADGMLAQVVATGQPRIVRSGPAPDGDPTFPHEDLSIAAVPVVTDGTVTGVLLTARRAELEMGAVELEQLGLLAPMVGSSLAAAAAHHSATNAANLDELTACANRRRLDRDLPCSLSRPGRVDPVGFVMVDVDHFKRYNDANGHAAGDVALRLVADVLRASVRPEDVVYRYGGEEFSILLPDTTLDAAQAVAERVRRAVADADIPGAEGQPNGRVTVSVGVAVATDDDPDALARRADAALYAAKAAGRNQVCTAP